MPSSRRTLVVGESLVDIVRSADGSLAEHVGGSPLNVAVGLARLGHDVTLATSFGRDARGQRVAAHLAADSVVLAPGSDSAEHTSTATATLDASGAASYTFDITWQAPPLGIEAAHVHTGSIGALLPPGGRDVLAAMEVARRRATVSYDPNVRPDLMGEPGAVRPEVERRVRLSDVVKASDEDITWLLGQESLAVEDLVGVLRGWVELGARLAVVTLGPKGALAVLSSGEVVEVPGRAVEVADTVGAGDSFAAGLLSALLDAGLLGGGEARERLVAASRDEVRDALQRGVDASAVTVSRAGANPPTREELAR